MAQVRALSAGLLFYDSAEEAAAAACEVGAGNLCQHEPRSVVLL
jgi:hypothetical protein